jgi:putative FmdB family regulatory protein
MPRYVYYCSKCNSRFEIAHTMSELNSEKKCGKCGEIVLRLPTSSFVVRETVINSKQKVGTVVNSFIKDTIEELKEQKEESRKEVSVKEIKK